LCVNNGVVLYSNIDKYYYLLVWNCFTFLGFESSFSSNKVLAAIEETSFKKLVEFYQPDVEHLDILLVDLKLWRRKLSRSSNNVPKSALQTLIECDANIFPNIFITIKIVCILSVSTITPEQMFSSLKIRKTYLRNTYHVWSKTKNH